MHTTLQHGNSIVLGRSCARDKISITSGTHLRPTRVEKEMRKKKPRSSEFSSMKKFTDRRWRTEGTALRDYRVRYRVIRRYHVRAIMYIVSFLLQSRHSNLSTFFLRFFLLSSTNKRAREKKLLKVHRLPYLHKISPDSKLTLLVVIVTSK